jgi:sec-independent protein translocase protein TatB
MFQHLPELAIILIIGLVIFGPEKLPEVAATAGRMVREVRQAMDTALNPEDTEVPEDFSTYYYESLSRSDEEVPVADEYPSFEDGLDFADRQTSRPVDAAEAAVRDPLHSETSSHESDPEMPRPPHA